ISSNAGVVSPDGEKIVFGARDESGKIMLALRALNASAARLLPGTENGVLPFWSPDSRSIGFFSAGKLKKIDVDGGPALPIADATGGRGGAWNHDGVIVFAAGVGLFRVSASGGDVSPVTNRQNGLVDPRFPSFLPDEKHFVFVDVAPAGR